MNRGDIILVRFPHPTGIRGKKRPAVVVQADAYNQTMRTIIVAEVTKNLTMATDAACLIIDVNTSEGKATGLKRDSVVSCLLLATIDRDRVDPGARHSLGGHERQPQRLPEGSVRDAVTKSCAVAASASRSRSMSAKRVGSWPSSIGTRHRAGSVFIDENVDVVLPPSVSPSSVGVSVSVLSLESASLYRASAERHRRRDRHPGQRV